MVWVLAHRGVTPVASGGASPTQSPVRAALRALALGIGVLTVSAPAALAADQPIRILSVTPDPQTQQLTVNSMTYDRRTETVTISVTPECYWVTIYPSYPGGEPVTFLTGVGGTEARAQQRDDSLHTFAVGGECFEPTTLTLVGLKPGRATISVGVLLYAQHADTPHLTYEVVLR
jgi:hypothetical protein